MSLPASAISIVVPVRDGARDLARCLDGVAALDPPPGQVVVVDDGSVDGSGDLAETRGAQVVRLPRSRGPAAARNIGARQARGEVLLFLDADVVPAPDVVGRVARHLSDPNVDAVFGSYDDDPAAPGLVSRYRNLLHHHVHQTSAPETATFWGACGAIRRATFEELGGFDESYRRPSVEDIELGARLAERGTRVRLDPDLQVRHGKRWTVGSMVRTDLFDRAVPWTELMLRRGRLATDLNLSTRERWSAVAAWAGLVGLLAGCVWRPLRWLGAAAWGALWWTHRSFYRLLARRGGARLAGVGVALHTLYYLYSAVGFALGVARHLLSSKEQER